MYLYNIIQTLLGHYIRKSKLYASDTCTKKKLLGAERLLIMTRFLFTGYDQIFCHHYLITI